MNITQVVSGQTAEEMLAAVPVRSRDRETVSVTDLCPLPEY
jgi:hypothetical protein